MSARDNGLSASRYTPLLELDPPLVEQVLDLLAAAGIAAYVEPVEGDRGPYQDVQLPERVVMRLQVQHDRAADARATVGATLPQLKAAFLADSAARDDRSAIAANEVDAAWARIVAGYDEPHDAVGRWSAAEDVDEPEADSPHGAPPTGSGLSRRLVRRDDRDGPDDTHSPSEPATPHEAGSPTFSGDPRAYVVDDPDEHFVPPPAPPLPETDAVTRMAWAGLIGGPALVLIIAVLGLQIEPWVVLIALLAFCGGVATLVARMGDHHRHDDDDWNDGAIV